MLLLPWRKQRFAGKTSPSCLKTVFRGTVEIFPSLGPNRLFNISHMLSHRTDYTPRRTSTHCTGRAGWTVQLLRGVLLFLGQCGHGGGQRWAWAGVGENERSLSSTGGVAGLFDVRVTLLKRRSLKQELFLFLQLQDRACFPSWDQ